LLSADIGGWQVVAPSAVAFSPASPLPRDLAVTELDDIVASFVATATRALAAGFEVVEVHMAHGYLLHEFLSPISNRRTDAYGGSLENRARLPLQVAKAVREVWPKHLPLFVRISATDGGEGGGILIKLYSYAIGLKKRGLI